jgi:hypothetical protein
LACRLALWFWFWRSDTWELFGCEGWDAANSLVI